MKKCECIYSTVKMLWYAVLCYGPMHSCSHALLSRIQPGIYKCTIYTVFTALQFVSSKDICRKDIGKLELAVQGPSGHRPKLGLGVTVSSLPCRQSGEARLLQTNARSH